MIIFNINEHLKNVDLINHNLKEKLKEKIKGKIYLVSKIQERGHQMTPKQFNFVKAETEFVDLLIHWMQLEEMKVDKIKKVVQDMVQSHGQSIYQGAEMRETIAMQKELINDLYKRNNQLIEILHERIKKDAGRP